MQVNAQAVGLGLLPVLRGECEMDHGWSLVRRRRTPGVDSRDAPAL